MANKKANYTEDQLKEYEARKAAAIKLAKDKNRKLKNSPIDEKHLTAIAVYDWEDKLSQVPGIFTKKIEEEPLNDDEKTTHFGLYWVGSTKFHIAFRTMWSADLAAYLELHKDIKYPNTQETYDDFINNFCLTRHGGSIETYCAELASKIAEKSNSKDKDKVSKADEVEIDMSKESKPIENAEDLIEEIEG